MNGGISVEYSRKFLKQASRLPKHIIDQVEEREVIFRGNPFDPRLDTHKLHGKEREAWAFCLTRRYRIKFLFFPGGKVLFLEVGTHDIYK